MKDHAFYKTITEDQRNTLNSKFREEDSFHADLLSETNGWIIFMDQFNEILSREFNNCLNEEKIIKGINCKIHDVKDVFKKIAGLSLIEERVVLGYLYTRQIKSGYDWVDDIYKDIIDFKVSNNIDQSLSVFYTPIKFRPKFMLIGDNPGGSEEDDQRIPPKEHDYFSNDYDYPMAERMRYIFSTPKLNKYLEESVKTNRVFYRSRNKSVIKKLWDKFEMKCSTHLLRIIEKIDPEIIIAESVGTFNKIIEKRTDEFYLKIDNKVLIRSGVKDRRKVIGIPHPSSAWGITNDHRNAMTKYLDENIF